MKVSWDYYSQSMESHKIHFPNHQPVTYRFFPTSLCGVLVFGSALPPPALLLLLLLPPPPPTTCPHTTCPHTTCSHTTCPHTTCPHTTCSHTTSPHTTCPHTTCSLCVAGAVFGDINRHFAWQAWHLVTSTVTLRGRRGTDGSGLALWPRLVPNLYLSFPVPIWLSGPLIHFVPRKSL